MMRLGRAEETFRNGEVVAADAEGILGDDARQSVQLRPLQGWFTSRSGAFWRLQRARKAAARVGEADLHHLDCRACVIDVFHRKRVIAEVIPVAVCELRTRRGFSQPSTY